MNNYKALVIGGSAGSFQVIVYILSHLPKDFPMPIFLSLHRLKHVRTGFIEALSIKSNIKIVEPNDNELPKKGVAYLAPANYHMLINLDKRISLSISKQVNHSRPSIDLSFQTAAEAYKDKMVGLILSGANKDGAKGLQKVYDYKGYTLIQDPKDAQISTMPNAVLSLFKPDKILDYKALSEFINQLK